MPAGTVHDAGDLMADPQLVARHFWRTFDHAVFGARPYDRFPGLWSTTDLEPYLPSGAYLGEHNFDVYPSWPASTTTRSGTAWPTACSSERGERPTVR